MKAAVGRECPLLTPQKASHPSVWPTDTKAWGGGSAGRRGPQDQRAARRSRRRARPEAPQLRPHAGGGGSREPSAHAPSLTDPSSARTDARRRGSRSGHAHPYRIGWSCEALPGSLAARRGSGRSHAGPLRALRAAALQTQRKGHETRDCCLSALPRPCPPGLHGMAGV